MSETEIVNTEAPRRGRPPNAERTAEVVYCPDDGDPIKTVWNGVEFRANVPVTIPYSKTVDSLVRVETAGPEGEIRSRAVPKKISMVELAKGNSYFSVDGVRPDRKMATQRLPTDPDQYRGYALSWIRATNTLRQLNERWDGEAYLRERCGLEQKDENYLSPFLEARREQLAEAA